MKRTRPIDEVQRRAWELHREHGHPKGYDGPCWGPTMAELEQAKTEQSGRGQS